MITEIGVVKSKSNDRHIDFSGKYSIIDTYMEALKFRLGIDIQKNSRLESIQYGLDTETLILMYQ